MVNRVTTLLLILLIVQPLFADTLSDADNALSSGDYRAAIEAYRLYLKDNPSSYEGRFGLARALAYSDNHTESIELLNGLLSDHSGDPDCLLLRGLVYSWQERFDAAEDDLKQVTGDHPDYVDAWSALGDVYRWSGSPEKAVTAYTRWIELQPDNPEPYIARARAHTDSRYFPLAREDLHEARTLRGDDDRIDDILRWVARNPASSLWEASLKLNVTTFTPGRADWNSYETSIRREFSSGTLVVTFIRASRWDKWDNALMLDGYLDLWRRAYGNLRVQTAKAVVLQRMDYIAEIFQGIGTGWEVSGGYRLMQFADKDEHVIILSVGKFIKSWYLRERLYLIEDSGRIGQTHSVMARLYIGKIDDYFELILGLSNTPEDLDTEIRDDILYKVSYELTVQKFIYAHLGFSLAGLYKGERKGPIERAFTLKLIYRL